MAITSIPKSISKVKFSGFKVSEIIKGVPGKNILPGTPLILNVHGSLNSR